MDSRQIDHLLSHIKTLDPGEEFSFVLDGQIYIVKAATHEDFKGKDHV